MEPARTEEPMKNYLVLCCSRAGAPARAISFYSAACALILAACNASNGPLFDEVEAPSDMMPDDGSNPVTEPPDEGEDMPPVDDGMPDPMDSMMSEDPPNDDLPLDGMNPVDDGSGGDDGGEEDPPDVENPPDEPPPEPEPTVPEIIQVFPEDGATGVDGETPIIITFSEPMNQAATEAAYQSEGIPSSGVAFTWNEDGTELTITPDEPLAYDSGPDPASVEALRYNFFISSSATDLEGDSLGVAAEFSFSVLRQIEGVFQAVQDRNLTGNWRSDGTYGGPNQNSNCARNTTTMCVGDATDNDGWRGFTTFDLNALPQTMTRLTGATLSFQVTSGDGTPFGNGNNALGQLMVDRASFDEIGVPAFTAPANDVVGPITQTGIGVGTVVSINVLSAVAEDAAAGAFAQFRLRFEKTTDNRLDADVIRSDWETHTLSVNYLIP
jgi:hypothetical protein